MLTRGAPTMVVVFFGALIDTLTAFVALAAANMPAIAGGNAPSDPGGTTAGPEPPALTSCSVPEPLPLRPGAAGSGHFAASYDLPFWSSHSKPAPVFTVLRPFRYRASQASESRWMRPVSHGFVRHTPWPPQNHSIFTGTWWAASSL